MRAHVSHLLCSDWSSEKVLIGLLYIQRELEPIYQKRRCIGELFSNKLTEAWDNFSKCWQPWRRKQEGQTFESNFWVLCHGKFKYYIYSYYCSHILGFKAPDLTALFFSIFQLSSNLNYVPFQCIQVHTFQIGCWYNLVLWRWNKLKRRYLRSGFNCHQNLKSVRFPWNG